MNTLYFWNQSKMSDSWLRICNKVIFNLLWKNVIKAILTSSTQMTKMNLKKIFLAIMTGLEAKTCIDMYQGQKIKDHYTWRSKLILSKNLCFWSVQIMLWRLAKILLIWILETLELLGINLKVWSKLNLTLLDSNVVKVAIK